MAEKKSAVVDVAVETTGAADPFAACFSDGPSAKDGFADVGTPDIDGWYSPEIGLVVHGKIVGMIRMPPTSRNPKERFVLAVRLLKPCKAFKEGDKEKKAPMLLTPGQVVGVGVRYKLQELLEYVTHQGEVWMRASGKKDLPGNQTMWLFDVKAKGQKAAPPTMLPAAMDVSGEDDKIPF